MIVFGRQHGESIVLSNRFSADEIEQAELIARALGRRGEISSSDLVLKMIDIIAAKTEVMLTRTGHKSRLGIEAPDSVLILRKELLETLQAQ